MRTISINNEASLSGYTRGSIAWFCDIASGRIVEVTVTRITRILPPLSETYVYRLDLTGDHIHTYVYCSAFETPSLLYPSRYKAALALENLLSDFKPVA